MSPDKNIHRVILHVDADAYFASVEQVLDPSLAGKPVIVGGNPDDRGVVASASYEARALGVKSAMPLAQARRLCPHAVFLRGSFSEYARVARMMRDVFYSFTPDIEMASLDEAYLDLSRCRLLHPSPLETAEKIKLAVKRSTGINVSVGLGSSRLVAKVASDFAKPNGIAAVLPGHEIPFLAPLPLRDLPGIGPRTFERLARWQLSTIGDLQRLSPAALEAALGPAGVALASRAHGLDSSPVEEALYPKSISRETTFETDTADRSLLEAMLSRLAARAASHLRSIRMSARTVTVKLRWADFSTCHTSRSLKSPSAHDPDFESLALSLFDRLFSRRMCVRLVGVALSGLSPLSSRQSSLFDEDSFLKTDRLYRAVDSVRERYGFSALVAGRAVDLIKSPDRNENAPHLRAPSPAH